MQTNRTIVFNNVRESKIELALRWKNYPKNLHKKIKVSLSLWLIYKRVAFYVLYMPVCLFSVFHLSALEFSIEFKI